jgi:hypothetical protein
MNRRIKRRSLEDFPPEPRQNLLQEFQRRDRGPGHGTALRVQGIGFFSEKDRPHIALVTMGNPGA